MPRIVQQPCDDFLAAVHEKQIVDFFADQAFAGIGDELA
jgi:hypothetical protein